MKSERTRTELQAKTSKMSPIHPQKSPLPPLSRKRTDFFSSLLKPAKAVSPADLEEMLGWDGGYGLDETPFSCIGTKTPT